MRPEEHHGHGRHGRQGCGCKGEVRNQPGAQTFRRGRALDFLQKLNVKRATLTKQLEQPELQSIHQVIIGELKAIELIRNEFIEQFDLHEGTDLEKAPEIDQSEPPVDDSSAQ